jgi:3-oxoacyl-(acyl-carrier-protein) synthase
MPDGFGMTADAGDITAIDPSGAARAMRAALTDARLNPDQIEYVNAHGTGTMLAHGNTAALRTLTELMFALESSQNAEQ